MNLAVHQQIFSVILTWCVSFYLSSQLWSLGSISSAFKKCLWRRWWRFRTPTWHAMSNSMILIVATFSLHYQAANFTYVSGIIFFLIFLKVYLKVDFFWYVKWSEFGCTSTDIFSYSNLMCKFINWFSVNY